MLAVAAAAADAEGPDEEGGGGLPQDGAAAGSVHRRSFSLSDAEAAWSWPCVYNAHGYCKNGSAWRFLHGVPEDDATAEREMAAVMRISFLSVVLPSDTVCVLSI